MAYYEIVMQHTENSFRALAHMQYDLFCQSNRIARTVISLAAMIAGALNIGKWWGVLLIVYGWYLYASAYSSANHTARKLSDQIKAAGMPFPASRFLFFQNSVEIFLLPEEKSEDRTILSYRDVFRLGEDAGYYYIFRDQYGGYMIPKEALGDKSFDFRSFLQERTGQAFRSRRAPVVRLLQNFREWQNRPQRL